MPTIKYKPTTPARRHMSVPSFEEVTKFTPEKSLLAKKKKNAGRNSYGRITVRHKGGGNRQRHAATEYRAYDAPTCMDKGCKEYWYCRFCTKYFSDADCTAPYECKPVLPALGHHYGETECSNCHNPIPQYTKITSYEQFKTIKPGASFIAVAEIDDGNGNTEYYVLKTPLNYTSADIDEDGCPDILQIDEDKNGTADILEVDADGDGIVDAMAFDGCWSETGPDGVLDDDEISQYLFELEMQYTNGYMVAERLLEAIPVTPERDGTIRVKDFGALVGILRSCCKCNSSCFVAM